MAIYNGRLPNIDKEEVKRYAGLRHVEGFPPHYVDEACKEIQLLAIPRGVYQFYDYDATTHTIHSHPPIALEGTSIQQHLAQAERVCVLAVTLGEDVEHRCSELFKEGNYTLGMLLDAAATTAVEQIADQVNHIINEEAKKNGYIPTWRFSPGYGNWPLTVQQELAQILDMKAIDLSVTEAHLLFPRKSVTAIIGLQTELSENATKRGCSSCNQPQCPSRKV